MGQDSSLAVAVERFVDALRNERNASPNTTAGYARDLKQLVAFCVERTGRSPLLGDVDVYLLRGWLAQLARKCTAASVARKISALRSLYKFLERRGEIDVNPTAMLESPKVRKPLPTLVNPEAATSIVEAPDGDTPGVRDRAMLELLYGGGLRVSELAGLSLGDIDLKQAEVRVLGKGRKERIIPLAEPCIAAVTAWLACRNEFVREPDPGALFLGERGKRIAVRRIQTLVRKYGILGAGRGDLHPHALRHSCATHMLDGGANLRAIQELLGHASLSTTQRYTHVSLTGMLRVYETAHPLAQRSAEGSTR